MISPVYWHPKIYEWVMKIIYRKTYLKRYLIIAKEAGNKEVLDLCCGDCKLSDFIKNYKGADINEIFVKSAKKRGLNVIKLDIAKDEIPPFECVILQCSLYQFVPHHEELIKKLLKKGKKVIISEPGINFVNSKNPIISTIAKLLRKTSKKNEYGFTKNELIKLYKKYKAKKIIDLGRDVMATFER